jgi:serine phosphatase RsbU (regulator of sigma subunit)
MKLIKHLKNLYLISSIVGFLAVLIITLIQEKTPPYFVRSDEPLAGPLGVSLALLFLGLYFFFRTFVSQRNWTFSATTPKNHTIQFFSACIVGLLISFITAKIAIFHEAVTIARVGYHLFISFSGVITMLSIQLLKPGQKSQGKSNRSLAHVLLELLLLSALIFLFIPYQLIDLSWLIGLVIALPVIIFYCTNQAWIFKLHPSKYRSTFQLLILLLVINLIVAVLLPLLAADIKTYPSTFQLLVLVILLSVNLLHTVISLLLLLFGLLGNTKGKTSTENDRLLLLEQVNVAILEGRTEKQIYDALFNNCLKLFSADAGWIKSEKGKDLFQNSGITIGSISQLNERINQQVKAILAENSHKTSHAFKLKLRTFGRTFRSVLYIPIFSGDDRIAAIFLLKSARRGFDQEAILRTNTLAKQAGVAIQNIDLQKEAAISQRMRSELSVARKVQQKLLPKYPETVGGVSFYASSVPAYEVGGDYYDIHRFKDGNFALIIADVSGNGVPAAMNMAQLKGVFQTLVHLRLPPAKFMSYSNMALSGCLDENVFITASYFHINHKQRRIVWSRAGHCPGIFYSKERDEVRFLEIDGLGLGILRDESFDDYVFSEDIGYYPGDLLFLYTDGIVEVKNEEGEEFGYERLKQAFYKATKSTLANASAMVLKEVGDFGKKAGLNDDHTLVFVKF